MKKHFYVYVLQSEKDSNSYAGFSTDLLQRLQQHQNGEVVSTKNRLPVTLVYWEGCLNQADATRRERYLKSSWGKCYIKKSIKELSHGVKGGYFKMIGRQFLTRKRPKRWAGVAFVLTIKSSFIMIYDDKADISA